MTNDKGESLSLRRGVSILRLFTERGQSLSLKEVVALTHLSKTACHRLLATWVAERFLIQSGGTARYELGPDLIAMARLGIGRSSLRDLAEPELKALARSTGDVALLHVLDGDAALCLDRHDGDYPVRTAGVQVGGRIPLHCGGGPLAILSFAPDDVVERVLGGPMAKQTARTLTTRTSLRKCLVETRARGFSVGDEDAFDYVVAVGAPIFDADGLIGAISVGGIKPRYGAERISTTGRATMSAADRISNRLGWAPAREPVARSR